MKTTFHVQGMTCDHCVKAVTAEVSKIPGVDAVTVDVDSGQVTVTSQQDLERAAVAAAVDEAGYELVG